MRPLGPDSRIQTHEVNVHLTDTWPDSSHGLLRFPLSFLLPGAGAFLRTEAGHNIVQLVESG